MHQKGPDMDIKKLSILVIVALALAALVPGSASAFGFTIKDEGKGVADKSLVFTGTMRFYVTYLGLGTGFECTTQSTVTVNGDEVELTGFGITTNTCVGFGIWYTGCKFSGPEPDRVEGLPWGVSVTGKDQMELEGSTLGGPGILALVFNKECLFTEDQVTFGGITWTVETKNGFISAIELSGEVLIDLYRPPEFFGGSSADVEGTLFLDQASQGTYNIVEV